MRDVFRTDDGQFHQAVLALNSLVLVRLVVERVAPKSDFSIEWEWMVWPVGGPWDDGEALLHGKEPTLAAAKQQAFDAGISMLADMTRERAPYLPAYHDMRSVSLFTSTAMMMR